jgi:hypothetical protein
MADPEKVKTIQESWLAVKDGAGSAIKDPSLLGSFSKEVVGFGASAFKFFGIIENANDLRKLWRDEEEKKKHSLLGRIGLSIVYAANIAASSIAAAVVLGASVVAAPIAAAIVSGAGLVKNTADFIKENEYHKKLIKQAADLETKLNDANVSFEAHTALYHDLQNAKTSISQLTAQRDGLSEDIKYLQSLGNKEESQDEQELTATYLTEEANEIAQELTQKSLKNKVLEKNYQGKHKEEGAEQNLQRVQAKQDLYQSAKNELLNKSKSASPSGHEKLAQQIKLVDAKLEKYAILQKHYEKIQKLEILLGEVGTQQANLDKKYSTKPYLEGTVDKALEAEYLSLRAEELTQEIATLKDPDIRAKKADANKEAADKVSGKGQDPSERMAHIKKTLIDQLTQQAVKVQGKIDNQENKLKSKERFASLFTKNPKEAMVGDATTVFNKSLELIDKKNQIKLTKIDRDKKAKGIGFAAAGLGLAACVCIPALWPVAGILTLVGAGVGVAWGVSSLWDKYKRSKTEKESKKEKEKEVEKLLTKIGEHMENKVEKENAKKAEVTLNLVTKLDETRSKLTGSEAQHDHVGQANNGVLTSHRDDRRKVEEASRVTPEPIADVVTPTKTTVASIKK